MDFPSRFKRAGATDPLVGAPPPAQALADAGGTGNLVAAALSPEERVAESRMRLQLIKALVNVPDSASVGDPRLTYKVVSDERQYQAECLTEFQRGLAAVVTSLARDPDDVDLQASKARLEADIQECRNATTNLFAILKRLTGMTRRTGGTHYLPDLGVTALSAGTGVLEKLTSEGFVALLTNMLAPARILNQEELNAIKSFRLKHWNLIGPLTQDAVARAIAESGIEQPVEFYLDVISNANQPGRA